jgi:hypothetical protein
MSCFIRIFQSAQYFFLLVFFLVSGLEIEITSVGDPPHWPCDTPLSPQKLALTSPTRGGRSVGVVRSRTKATEVVLYIYIYSLRYCALLITLLNNVSNLINTSLWTKGKVIMNMKGGMCKLRYLKRRQNLRSNTKYEGGDIMLTRSIGK